MSVKLFQWQKLILTILKQNRYWDRSPSLSPVPFLSFFVFFFFLFLLVKIFQKVGPPPLTKITGSAPDGIKTVYIHLSRHLFLYLHIYIKKKQTNKQIKQTKKTNKQTNKTAKKDGKSRSLWTFNDVMI